MFAKVNSSYLHGIKGIRVDVECDSASYGLPSFSIVGLGDNAIKESKDRVKAALKNLDYHFFNHPLTINLAPADMKEGSHFDLPISLAILLAAGVIEKNLDDYLFLGELSLIWQVKKCYRCFIYGGIFCKSRYKKDYTSL